MAITRWNPSSDLYSLQSRMNRLFQDMYGDWGRSDESLHNSAFAPPVDVYEDENNLSLKFEVPGINEKDIDVNIDNNVLTVSGERKFEKNEKEENFHRIERRYGSFTRSFTLPQSVDPNTCNANYDDGVLNIKFAKKAESKRRQIKIGSSGKTLQGKAA